MSVERIPTSSQFRTYDLAEYVLLAFGALNKNAVGAYKVWPLKHGELKECLELPPSASQYPKANSLHMYGQFLGVEPVYKRLGSST